jgi:hypothetical protein
VSIGEWLTRGTIWLALGGYAAGAALMLGARRHPGRLICARWPWTIGCAFFAAHVVCAFSYYHGWSHFAAYLETARQTAELTGFHWGGGIFLNYLLGILWLGEVIWWWLAPVHFARRPRPLVLAWHGFLYFMVFNGTVVFGSGPVRWFGAMLCVGLAALWWRSLPCPPR